MSRVQISEDRLRIMADHIKNSYGRESPEIGKVLKKGELFRDSGLTPFYIYSEETSKVYVTSKEAMDGELNG